MQTPEKIKLKHSPTAAEKEATAALRAELQIELQNKRQCGYQSYECTQLSLDGYNYCLKHILNDKNAPFKQCCYVYTSNSKRCPQAAPCDKKDFGYCSEHALKATLARNRQNCRYPAPQTAEVLLHSLSHYVKKPRGRTSSVSASTSTSHQNDENQAFKPSELKVTESLDPFIDIDVSGQLNPSSNDGLDLCSDSESDVDAATYSSVWHDAQADSSSDESIDSEQEDYLKHANIFTAEEITMVTREKLIRLQSLYIEQYRHLQYLLKEHKRKYLHTLKREKETCCNIYGQVRDNPKEQRLYKKLKALNKYHKPHGIEAILNKRAHELRNKLSEGASTRLPNHAKCAFTEGGVKCGEKPLPLSRHCRKHILEDPNQVLFRPCGKIRADVECNTPVEAIFEDSTCNLHMDIPNLRSYNQPRRDSDSDYDDLLETSNTQPTLADLSTTCNVKTELIDFASEIPKMSTVPSLLFEETSNSSDAKTRDGIIDDIFPQDDTTKSEIDQESCRSEELKADIHFKNQTGIVNEEKQPTEEDEEVDVVNAVIEEENSKVLIDIMDVHVNEEIDVCEVDKMDTNISENEEIDVCEVEKMEININENLQCPMNDEKEVDNIETHSNIPDKTANPQDQDMSTNSNNLTEKSEDFDKDKNSENISEENVENVNLISKEVVCTNNDDKIDTKNGIELEVKGDTITESTKTEMVLEEKHDCTTESAKAEDSNLVTDTTESMDVDDSETQPEKEVMDEIKEN